MATAVYRDRDNSERRLLTAKQTARQLNISERHLYTLTRRQEIGCVCVGRKKLYSPDAIDRFIADHSRGPAA